MVRDGEDNLFEAPKDGKIEITGLNQISGEPDKTLFLVHFDSKPLTLSQVKEAMEGRYAGITFNTEAITVEKGLIRITGSILSTEDWNIVKQNGKKDQPFRITLLADDSVKGEAGPESGKQLVKIAMYQDGKAVLEKK